MTEQSFFLIQRVKSLVAGKSSSQKKLKEVSDAN